ncbi:type IV secretion system protein [Raoultella terrigena]|uniref:type IV secretion system protein n=1 Tax=Raoultella terrigena TaxID=577 RepID=UPI0005F86348|nr:type IV secretion system protein [Raoultella terrigena]
MSGGVFSGMNNAIMGGLNAVLQGQSSVYGSMMVIIVTSSFTSYIIFRGYQTLAGKLQKPVEDVAWDTARMFLIMMFVTNMGGWLDTAIAAINGLKNGFSGDDNIWVLLDTVWGKAQELGQALYNQDDSVYVRLNGGFAEFLVWGGAIFVLIVTTIVNLLAEITILLLTTTGPVFIFCLLYGFLRPMFDNWLKTIFTAILTIMFSALFVRISIKYTNDILDAASQTVSESNMVTLAAQCLLASVGAGIFVWFSAKISMALGGAATQATMQGIAMSGIRSLGNTAKDTSKPVMKELGNGLGKIGDRAAENLKGGSTPSQTAKDKRRASIQTALRNRSDK